MNAHASSAKRKGFQPAQSGKGRGDISTLLSASNTMRKLNELGKHDCKNDGPKTLARQCPRTPFFGNRKLHLRKSPPISPRPATRKELRSKAHGPGYASSLYGKSVSGVILHPRKNRGTKALHSIVRKRRGGFTGDLGKKGEIIIPPKPRKKRGKFHTQNMYPTGRFGDDPTGTLSQCVSTIFQSFIDHTTLSSGWLGDDKCLRRSKGCLPIMLSWRGRIRPRRLFLPPSHVLESASRWRLFAERTAKFCPSKINSSRFRGTLGKYLPRVP